MALGYMVEVYVIISLVILGELHWDHGTAVHYINYIGNFKQREII